MLILTKLWKARFDSNQFKKICHTAEAPIWRGDEKLCSACAHVAVASLFPANVIKCAPFPLY
jgi:hypothetical protein